MRFVCLGFNFQFLFNQIRSVAQSCPTPCDPMNRSTPGLPVHHQLPEFTETHVHRVSDAIQPSHPLSSPSPLAPNPSQHQSLFQRVNSLHDDQSTGVSALASFPPKNTQYVWPNFKNQFTDYLKCKKFNNTCLHSKKILICAWFSPWLFLRHLSWVWRLTDTHCYIQNKKTRRTYCTAQGTTFHIL